MPLPPIAKRLLIPWRTYILLLTPIILLPLMLSPDAAYRCAYVMLMMIIFWISEALPLPVTSLFPAVFFPLLGIMTTGEACAQYLKETNMMFVGGIWAALAVEYSNLHYRIALKVILIVGTTPMRLLLGLMITTMFLSMWISNSAATALMAPIVGAMVTELKACREQSMRDSETPPVPTTKNKEEKTGDEEPERPDNETIGVYIGVAYAAGIGGIGTLIGTGTNLSLKGIYESTFPQAHDLNFLTWMYFGVPYMLISTVVISFFLLFFYMGLGRKKSLVQQANVQNADKIKALIRDKYNVLGPMTFHEIMVVVWFSVLIALWVTRQPQIFPGWAQLFFPENNTKIKDASPVMLIIVILFLLPSNLKFLNRNEPYENPTPAVLDWPHIQKHTPWGLMLLLGGSFSMALGMQKSHLSDKLGDVLAHLNVLPTPVIMMITSLMTTIVTQFAANVAASNIALPVLAVMAVKMELHPLYLMMPATIAASLAFMLPVSTPPNAIVLGAGNLVTMDLMKAGAASACFLLLVLFALFLTYGVFVYNLNVFPCFATNSCES